MKNIHSKGNNLKEIHSYSGPAFYEIKVQGYLDQVWAGWFEGMALTYSQDNENGLEYTLISGTVIDQPALHGLLAKVRDLNLALISVFRFVPGTNKAEQIAIKPEG